MVLFDRTPESTGEWECMECGYVADGIRNGKPRECPECGAPAAAFEFFGYDGSDEDGWEADDPEQEGDPDDASAYDDEDKDRY